jgi:Dual-action HEIGH metallo-peptidase
MNIPTRLRRARIPAALLCAGSLLAGCQDGLVAPAAANRIDLADPLVQQVVAMGFRAGDIAERGEYFVVEGDMLIRKADLQRAPRLNVSATGGPSFHYRTSTLINQDSMARRGVRVDLSGITSHSGWTTAMRNAMNAWNTRSAGKVFFVEVTSNADVSVAFDSNLGNSIAQGGLTINGYPGSVYINQSYNSLSAGNKLAVMIHELGHTIGHRHTDWRSRGEDSVVYGAVHIPGTPTGSSTSSVMYSTNSTWNGYFTAYDNIATSYMYPADAVTGTSAVVNASGYPELTWSAMPNAGSYVVVATEWRYEYLMDDWNGDPVYGWTRYAGGTWYTTGTSFTAPYVANPDLSTCTRGYTVAGIYPTGKMAIEVGFDVEYGC